MKKIFRSLGMVLLGLSLLGLGGVGGGGGVPKYTPPAWNFDGSTHTLTITEDLNIGTCEEAAKCPASHADGKLGTLSFWYLNSTSGANQIVFSAQGSFVEVLNDTAGNWTIILLKVGGGNAIDVFGSDGTPQWDGDGQWHHLMASWDVSTNCFSHLYIDDVDQLSGPAPTCDNVNIDYTRANHQISGLNSGSQKWAGCLSEIYFNYWEYLDLSIAANRRKFIDQNGEPVNFGKAFESNPGGAHVTGNEPTWYGQGPNLSTNQGYANVGSSNVDGGACSTNPGGGF